ncbi:MAG: hypothetical protein LBU67_10420 [Oscillospiraceae bacterium]|jgi:tetratricopeptide (TPR) repeat protein|nr:hypothetical protein [Oscillospiraceae bacterium]
MDKRDWIRGYLQTIDEQLALDPHNEMLWLYKGICYLDMDDRPGTIQALTQGIAKCPEYGRLLEERGHRYINVGQYEKAAADLALAHAWYPDDHSVCYHLGLAHYLMAEYARAERSFRNCVDACSVFGDTVSAVNWLWNTLQHEGKTQEAADLLATVPLDVDESPEGVSGYYRLLMMYKGIRTPEEIIAAVDQNPVGFVTMGYGVYNYYYYVAKDTARAEALLNTILSEEAQPWQMGYDKATWEAGFGYRGAVTERYRRTIYPN